MMRLTLITLVIAAMAGSVRADPPICKGIAAHPKQDAVCRTKKSKSACLGAKLYASNKFSESCIWHQLKGDKVVEHNSINWSTIDEETTPGMPARKFTGSVCGAKLTISVPSSARGAWSVGARLFGGPYDGDTTYYNGAKVPTASSGCVAGVDSTSCTMQVIAPKGYALDPAFSTVVVNYDFYTKDSKRIANWKADGKLSVPLTVTQKWEYLRCPSKEAYPSPVASITDDIIFGPQPFALYGPVNNYYMIGYRAYRLTNVTGASWSVKTKSLAKDGKKTPLTVMLIKDADWFAYVEGPKCIKTACPAPPKSLAIGNSYCSGTSCSGSVVGTLGGKKGVYRLVVSYPTINNVVCSTPACGTFSNTSEVATPFKKERVMVSIKPKYYDLD